jgi:hypothetical protein
MEGPTQNTDENKDLGNQVDESGLDLKNVKIISLTFILGRGRDSNEPIRV